MQNNENIPFESEILKFELAKKENFNLNNSLKEFLLFAKSAGIKTPMSFAYASDSSSILQQLSIKESIILESVTTSISSSKELKIPEYLKQFNNNYLLELFNRIGDVEQSPATLDYRCRKLAILFKAFIKQCPYLFLELPEKHLSEDDVVFISKILEWEAQNGRTIFLTTENHDAFAGLISKTVGRNADKEFEIHEIFEKKESSSSILKFHAGNQKKAA